MNRWFFPIRRIEQGDDHGCAIACTAMVCGISYDRAKQEFFPHSHAEFLRDDKNLHVDHKRMMSVIRRLGYTCTFEENFMSYKLPSIVMFDWGFSPGTHAIVWEPWRECFLDPGYDWPMNNKTYMKFFEKKKYGSVILTGRKKR